MEYIDWNKCKLASSSRAGADGDNPGPIVKEFFSQANLEKYSCRRNLKEELLKKHIELMEYKKKMLKHGSKTDRVTTTVVDHIAPHSHTVQAVGLAVHAENIASGSAVEPSYSYGNPSLQAQAKAWAEKTNMNSHTANKIAPNASGNGTLTNVQHGHGQTVHQGQGHNKVDSQIIKHDKTGLLTRHSGLEIGQSADDITKLDKPVPTNTLTNIKCATTASYDSGLAVSNEESGNDNSNQTLSLPAKQFEDTTCSSTRVQNPNLGDPHGSGTKLNSHEAKIVATTDKCGKTKTDQHFGLSKPKMKKSEDQSPKSSIGQVSLPNANTRNNALKAILMPYIRIPYPRLSRLPMEEQIKYIELFQKYSNYVPSKASVQECKEINQLRELQIKVTGEQQDFMAYLENVASKSSGDYGYIHVEASNYVNKTLDVQRQRVTDYPRYYIQHDSVLLSSVPTNVMFTHTHTLLEMGKVAKVILPSNTNDACVSRLSHNHAKFYARFPPDGMQKLRTHSEVWAKQVCSKDPNVEKLTQCNSFDVVISSSGLKCILDNLGAQLNRQWEVPVVVKEVEVEECGQKCKKKIVYVDKPLVAKHWTVREKIRKFCKVAMKVSYQHPDHMNCLQFGKNLIHDDDSADRKQRFMASDDMFGSVDVEMLESFGIDSEPKSKPVMTETCPTVKKGAIEVSMNVDPNVSTPCPKVNDVKKGAIEVSKNEDPNVSPPCPEVNDVQHPVHEAVVPSEMIGLSKAGKVPVPIHSDSFQSDSEEEDKLFIHVNASPNEGRNKEPIENTSKEIQEAKHSDSEVPEEFTDSKLPSDTSSNTHVVVDENPSSPVGLEENPTSQSLLDESPASPEICQETDMGNVGGVAHIHGGDHALSSHFPKRMKMAECKIIPLRKMRSTKQDCTLESESDDPESTPNRRRSLRFKDKVADNNTVFPSASSPERKCRSISKAEVIAALGSPPRPHRVHRSVQQSCTSEESIVSSMIPVKTPEDKHGASIITNNTGSENTIAVCATNAKESQDGPFKYPHKAVSASHSPQVESLIKPMKIDVKEQPQKEEISGFPLDQLLHAQSKTFEQPKQTNRSGVDSTFVSAMPEPKPAPSKPGLMDISSEEMVEDPIKYVQMASDDLNVTYNTWRLGDLKLLVRCSLHGHMKKYRGKPHFVEFAPKVEYQSQYGVEQVTLSETARAWCSSLIKKDAHLIRPRIHYFSSDVIHMEDLQRDQLLHPGCCFSPTSGAALVHAVLRKLTTLAIGHYLLGHVPGNAHAHIKKSVETNRGVYDLHQAYLGPNSVTKDILSSWIPIDPSVMLPYHKKYNRIPATFEPRDAPYTVSQGKPFQSQGKKKKKKKRRGPQGGTINNK